MVFFKGSNFVLIWRQSQHGRPFMYDFVKSSIQISSCIKGTASFYKYSLKIRHTLEHNVSCRISAPTVKEKEIYETAVEDANCLWRIGPLLYGSGSTLTPHYN